jgi:hypothetical protein
VPKKIISFSLWGNNSLYTKGALLNVDEAKEVYPEWICRFYISDDCPIVQELKNKNCEVTVMKKDIGFIPAFWRFSAASDINVDYVIFRDCDSIVNSKEAAAVEEWIKSGKKLHLMKDAQPHKIETIMAGMWGVRGKVIKNIDSLISSWISFNDIKYKYTDQVFLKKIIWPLLKDSVINHGYNSPSGVSLPFPPHKKMKYGEYVGQVINLP